MQGWLIQGSGASCRQFSRDTCQHRCLSTMRGMGCCGSLAACVEVVQPNAAQLGLAKRLRKHKKAGESDSKSGCTHAMTAPKRLPCRRERLPARTRG